MPLDVRTLSPFGSLRPDTRIVLDGRDDNLFADIMLGALRREGDHARRQSMLPGDLNYLALSGGGADGAFGAGLLTAWTETGTRPEFQMVTGVSTGALIAPFAFLGARYDRVLEYLYTAITKTDLLVDRDFLDVLVNESLYDTTPLRNMVRRIVTAEMVQEIAHEYRAKGRLLFVASTNLDAPVGVLWNLGAIADSGHAGAAAFIADILVASASIPGAFPPVMIRFDSSGQEFEEMHVDGGAISQVMLYPPSLNLRDIDPDLVLNSMRRRRNLYIVRNARLGRRVETTERNMLKIANRAISTLIATQGVGDLYQLFLLAKRDSMTYRVSYIPGSFSERPEDLFDQDYMKKLFQFGQSHMRSGNAWNSYPPGYSPRPILG